MSKATASLEAAQAEENGIAAPLLRRLYFTHWTDLCRYVALHFGAGPPEPQDVAQAAFARFAGLDNPAAVRDPGAYLRRIAHNIVLDERRSLAVRRANLDAQRHEAAQQTDELTPERVLLGQEAQVIVRARLAKMPRLRRRALLLNRIHGLSAAEIARRMRKPETTIRDNIQRALADLEAALKHAGARP